MKILKNKIVKFFLKLFVSLAFVAWLIFKIDWQEVLFYISKISFWNILIYVAVLLFGMAISAYKWKILAKFKGFDISLKKSFQLYLAGAFINNLMPSFIGGDTYKAYQLGKKDKKYVSAAASVFVDRITGLIGAMILSVIFAALNWQMVAEHKILLIILVIIFLILFAMVIIGASAKFSFWQKLLQFMPKKIVEIIIDFAEYGNNKNTLFKSFLLAIAYNLIGLAVVNYILFWGLGIQVGILNYLTVIFLVSIVSALPVSVNNIGIKEWAYITFFGFFGIASSGVVAVAIISRVIQMVVSFAAVPYYLKNKNQGNK
ncbi:MAG TPA: lysylphosphatidylglycerol synthase transmembrane domain-containing protein [Candidatus Moranbacteria bacterium]|nr:lysylphosphatidylglycerol synthase transmembrane domain-containing protein [Candidatus Moranbacteria bacterium]HSA08408.1 lysylphosphatidylglycerol synthase transmembrane domain-containing protein [Candidatus Moranbacteria bacterium]